MIVLFALPSVVATPPGEGRFQSDGSIFLQGIRAATFIEPTVALRTGASEGLTFEFTASELYVDRVWSDAAYADVEDPFGNRFFFSQDAQTHREQIYFSDATGRLRAVKDELLGAVFFAYGPGLSVTLSQADAADLQTHPAGDADHELMVNRDLNTTDPYWARERWRPSVEVPAHLVTVASRSTLTLSGDFDVYLFQVDWQVDDRVFRTGADQNGPGRATIERDILHLRGANLTLKADRPRVLSTGVDAALSGSIRLVNATGHFDEHGGTYRAGVSEIVLFGDLDMAAEVVGSNDGQRADIRVQGDLLASNFPRLALSTQERDVVVGSLLLAILLAASGFFWVFYTRLPPGALLDNPTRRRIVEVVRENPGIHVRELVRRTGAGRGNVTANLHRLARAGLLRMEHEGRYVLIFATGAGEDVGLRLRSQTARKIWDAVAARASVDAVELQREVGVSRQLLAYHLRALEKRGLVDTRDVAGRKMVTSVAARQEGAGAS